MRAGSLTVAVLVLVTSLVFIYLAHLLGASHNPDDVGPGYLPTGVGVVLVALSVILIVQCLLGKHDEADFRPGFTRHGGLFMAACLVYVVAIPWLGFFLATFLYLAGGVFVVEGRLAIRLALTAGLGFVAFVYAVFWELLGVPLP